MKQHTDWKNYDEISITNNYNYFEFILYYTKNIERFEFDDLGIVVKKFGGGLNQGGIEIIDDHFKSGIVHSQGLAEGAGLSH